MNGTVWTKLAVSIFKNYTTASSLTFIMRSNQNSGQNVSEVLRFGWKLCFDRKQCLFTFPCLVPLASDRSVWHTGYAQRSLSTISQNQCKRCNHTPKYCRVLRATFYTKEPISGLNGHTINYFIYTESKVRTTLYSIINSTTGKCCSVAFIWMLTSPDSKDKTTFYTKENTDHNLNKLWLKLNFWLQL